MPCSAGCGSSGCSRRPARARTGRMRSLCCDQDQPSAPDRLRRGRRRTAVDGRDRCWSSTGRFALVPPITIAVVLALIGVIVVVLALPVRRVARREPNATCRPVLCDTGRGDREGIQPVRARCSAVPRSASRLFLLTRTVTATGSVLMALARVGGCDRAAGRRSDRRADVHDSGLTTTTSDDETRSPHESTAVDRDGLAQGQPEVRLGGPARHADRHGHHGRRPVPARRLHAHSLVLAAARRRWPWSSS